MRPCANTILLKKKKKKKRSNDHQQSMYTSRFYTAIFQTERHVEIGHLPSAFSLSFAHWGSTMSIRRPSTWPWWSIPSSWENALRATITDATTLIHTDPKSNSPAKLSILPFPFLLLAGYFQNSGDHPEKRHSKAVGVWWNGTAWQWHNCNDIDRGRCRSYLPFSF